MNAQYENRLRNALAAAEKDGFDAVCATRAFNVYYMTGFWGSGVFVGRDGTGTLLVNKLELERARANSAVEVELYEPGSFYEKLKGMLAGKRVACDNGLGSFMFEAAKQVNLSPTDLFERVRSVKDEAEVRALIEGGKVMDRVFENAKARIKPGITERELYASIVKDIIELGGDIIPYEDTVGTEIVAFGGNSSYPHYSPPSNRALKDGDAVLLDLTLRYGGYVVDFTRTMFFKSAGKFERETYELVREAQQRAISAIRPGVGGKELHEIAENTFGDKRELFVHSLGHGVGLEVHERPLLSKASKDLIEVGSCFTVEPGLYYRDRLGVRIEDSICMTKTGPVMITNSSRDLTVL